MSKRQGLTGSWLASAVAAKTLAAVLVVVVAEPAAADPVTEVVGVGSATTQDIMNTISDVVGGGIIGSFNATEPGTSKMLDVIVPKDGCVLNRPPESTSGIWAVRKSINPATGPETLPDAPEPGCVDFARASSGPGSAASPTGDLVYVPFALDAVATATGPATATPGAVATEIRHADLFSLANLQTMYRTCSPVTPAGSTVQYVPDGTVTDATHQPIHLYVPLSGSGTRAYWLDKMGLAPSDPLPSCIHVGTTNWMMEDDGTVFATDSKALGPFSIGQWVGQRNGHSDRRKDAVLHKINGVAPLNAAGKLNPAYPLLRELYNVVSYDRVTSTAHADQTFVTIFKGASSQICTQTLSIMSHGFGVLSGAPLGHTCGQIATDLRAVEPSANPVLGWQVPGTTEGRVVGAGSATTQDMGALFENSIEFRSTSIVSSVGVKGADRVQYTANGPCDIARPRTDQAAIDALRADITKQVPCVSFARVASEPEHLPNPPSGDVSFYPYAVDGLGYVVSRASSFSLQANVATLREVFTCQRLPLIPVLPGYGSQLRKHWLSTLGLTDSAQLTTTYPCLRDTISGKPILDNDIYGVTDQDVMPYSVAQYVAQTTGRSKGPSNLNVGTTRLGMVGGLGGGNPLVVNTADYSEQVSWTTANSQLPATLPLTKLQEIYKCVSASVGGVSVTPALPPSSTLRSTWLQLMGITESQISSGLYPCLRVRDAANDGRLAGANDVLPYSIPTYLAQSTGGSADIRGAARIRSIERQATSGAETPVRNGNPIQLNTGYGLTHRVYNAVAKNPAYDNGLVLHLFRGNGSLVCSEGDNIDLQGFAPLPEHECGGSNALMAQTLPAPVAAPSRSDSQDKPVYLVHGYNWDKAISCHSTWDAATAAMRNWGWTGPLRTVGYYSGDTGCTDYVAAADRYHSIIMIARQLAYYIYAKESVYGRSVDVIAHSMGGLVTAAMISGVQHQWPGFPPYLYIEDVATLGTPYEGALPSTLCVMVALVWIDLQCIDMFPLSPFLDVLDRNPQGSAIGTDWTEVTSCADEHFGCSNTDPTEFMHYVRYCTCDNLSHGDLVSDTGANFNYGVAYQNWNHNELLYDDGRIIGHMADGTAPGPIRWAYNAMRYHWLW